jgi:hypothetical protein
MWSEGVRIVSASDGVTRDDADLLRVDRVRHDRQRGYWQVDAFIEHDDKVGHCLELRDAQENVWTILLPTVDPKRRYRYRFEFELAPGERGGDRPMTRLAASVFDDRGDQASILTDLSHLERVADPQQIASVLESASSHEWHGGPFAATVAGLLALKAGRGRLALEFVNIAIAESKAPFDTGSPLLRSDWSAFILGLSVDQGRLLEPDLYIAALPPRADMPSTGIGIQVATTTLRRVLRQLASCSPSQRSALRLAYARVKAAADSLAGDGLFASYPDMTAEDVLAMTVVSQSERRVVEEAGSATASESGIEVAGDKKRTGTTQEFVAKYYRPQYGDVISKKPKSKKESKAKQEKKAEAEQA